MPKVRPLVPLVWLLFCILLIAPLGWLVYRRLAVPQPAFVHRLAAPPDGLAAASGPHTGPHRVYRPELGMELWAGRLEVVVDHPAGGPALRYTVTKNEDGYRVTSAAVDSHAGMPEIWIFGCSYTLGQAVNDDETWPWQVQRALPAYRVRNFAINGFATTQALLQLRAGLAGEPPRYAVFAYASFHRERNVATPARLRAAREAGQSWWPRAVLEEATGRVRVVLVSTAVPPDVQPVPEACQNAVTIALFRELRRLCRDRGVVPVLGVLAQDAADPVVRACAEMGFCVVDMQVNTRDPLLNCLPYDGHPNARAQALYARKFLRHWPGKAAGQAEGPALRVGPKAAGRPGVEGDLNGDGRGEILLHRRHGGEAACLSPQPAGRLELARLFRETPVPAVWQLADVVELTGDRHLDLLWHETDKGRLAYWQMEGFVRRGGDYIAGPAVPASWVVVGCLDFNRDGSPDVLWHDTAANALQIWLLDGVTHLDTEPVPWRSPVPAHGFFLGTVPAARREAAVAFWHDPAGGAFAPWTIDRQGAVAGGRLAVPQLSGGGWQPRAVVDLDGNGAAEILWQKEKTGAIRLVEFTGAAPAVRPLALDATFHTHWQIEGPR